MSVGMGHIVFAAPEIERFHLLERLARELQSRGHRLTVLCLDAVAFTFWSTQGLSAALAAPGPPQPLRVPLHELAEVDGRRTDPRRRGRVRAGAERRLARLLPSLLRYFDNEAPDLVLLHQTRTSGHALLQYLARECG